MGWFNNGIGSILSGFPNGGAVRMGIGAVFEKLVVGSECRSIRDPAFECSGIGGMKS
jgi:hypothetical protein